MSSAPFAPFAANDNMRHPAYRTSHPARFHPYSRAHPSLHHERFSVRLTLLYSSLHSQLTPNQTAVGRDYRSPEYPRSPVRGLASSVVVRKPVVVLVFVFF